MQRETYKPMQHLAMTVCLVLQPLSWMALRRSRPLGWAVAAMGAAALVAAMLLDS